MTNTFNTLEEKIDFLKRRRNFDIVHPMHRDRLYDQYGQAMETLRHLKLPEVLQQVRNDHQQVQPLFAEQLTSKGLEPCFYGELHYTYDCHTPALICGGSVQDIPAFWYAKHYDGVFTAGFGAPDLVRPTEQIFYLHSHLAFREPDAHGLHEKATAFLLDLMGIENYI